MIAGIGVDLIEIYRIQKMLLKYGDHFAEKIFCEEEIAYCSEKAKPEINFAARFAAKEAVLKAFGTGLARGIGWKDIQIHNLDNGKPFVKLLGEAKIKFSNLKIKKVHISLSHTAEVAMAFIIFEK